MHWAERSAEFFETAACKLDVSSDVVRYAVAATFAEQVGLH